MEIMVYADVLFLINFIINLILLKISLFFTKNPSSTLRLTIASAFGALYALFMFFPSLNFLYFFPLKFIVSYIMIKIALPVSKFFKSIKFTAIFYLVSFSFAGILFALTYMGAFSNGDSPIIKNGIFYFNISISRLIVSSAICYLLISIASAMFKRNKTLGIKKLRIYLSGRICEISALSDSGNLLTDPLTNTPVVVAEKKHLNNLFPNGIPDVSKHCNYNIKFRMIPFSTLGNSHGMMTGFIPDEVRIDGKKTSSVIVAISPETLSEKDEYNALFNPSILA